MQTIPEIVQCFTLKCKRGTCDNIFQTLDSIQPSNTGHTDFD